LVSQEGIHATVFNDPRTIERLHGGPLSDDLNSYAAFLSQYSYSQASAQRQLLLVSRFSQWLQRNGIELRKMDEDVAHVLRHSSAMELLQAGVDRAVIALWLGHESVETTQIYLDADLALERTDLDQDQPH
jgi:site-specific recombinase XerD